MEFAGEQLAFKVNQRRLWNFGVVKYPMKPRCHPKLTIFFQRRIYGLMSAIIF
jgi:hypothetical protein